MVESSHRSSFGFRFAVFNQSFKEQVNAQFGFFQPMKTVDPKVEEALERLGKLKKYISCSEAAIKKMIEGMKESMEGQRQLSLVSKDVKVEDKNLNTKLNSMGDSLNSNTKDIECLYLPPMENYHEWLRIFLTKAIADAEHTISQYNNTRTEMDTIIQIINQTKQRISEEIAGSQEQRRLSLLLKEHEQTYRIKKTRYDQLNLQVIQKIDMLETKRNSDMPNYLNSIQQSMQIYHNQSCQHYSETLKNINDHGLPNINKISLPTPSSIYIYNN